jgi:hypothetical protein
MTGFCGQDSSPIRRLTSAAGPVNNQGGWYKFYTGTADPPEMKADPPEMKLVA